MFALSSPITMLLRNLTWLISLIILGRALPFNSENKDDGEPNGDYTYRGIKKSEVIDIINTREEEYKKKLESGGGKRKSKKTRKRRSRR